ncbi:basic proline-rich protein-like [Accipiter gentilis]|uniref:basic proline-rich protein-like n=1 Tax=Astur gentilis TaxID=8957 RepID=UPI00210FBDA2|nr:basic proline-rich protein-like [Accipiter gentilis]
MVHFGAGRGGGGRGVRWGGARGRGLDTGEVWARGRGVACREQVWVCKGGGGVCPRLPPSAGSDVPHYFRFRRRHADRRPLGSFPPALRGPARSGSSRHHLGAAGAAGGAWGECGGFRRHVCLLPGPGRLGARPPRGLQEGRVTPPSGPPTAGTTQQRDHPPRGPPGAPDRDTHTPRPLLPPMGPSRPPPLPNKSR